MDNINISSDMPIGMFDSGVGGLSVAKEIMRQLPNEKIVYFGDTARVPYGGKSKDTILRYSRQIIRFLQTKNVKAIVIACNTASAFALEEIKAEIDIPIIGVVKPGAKTAVETTKNNKIGVIGTEGTINSAIYEEFIHKLKSDIKVYGKACPLFVPLVEEGWLDDDVTKEVVKRYLTELMDKDIDTLIMGCTHYPMLKDVIGEVMGEGVKLVNPAYETAVGLAEMLKKKNILADANNMTNEEKYDFYVSDAPDKFKKFADSILSLNVKGAEKIDIEDYYERFWTE